MRARSLAALVLAACGATPPQPPPSPPIRNFSLLDYVMVGPAGELGSRLEIGARGAMRLIRGAGGAGEAIGYFEGRLRPDEVRALARALDEIDSLPDHHERVTESGPARWMRVTWPDGTHVDKGVELRRAVDPRLAAIVRRLDGYARRAAAHPRQTVAIALESVTPGPGRVLEARLAIVAGGDSGLELPRPADFARLRQLGLRLEGGTEAPVVEIIAEPDGPVALAPGGRLSIVAHAVVPSGVTLPASAVAVARFDGTLPPIHGTAVSASATVASRPGSFDLAWPTRVCGAASTSPSAVRVETCGCSDRVWCEVREGPEPVLVAWEDLTVPASCTACRRQVGTCALPGRLAFPVARMLVNGTIGVEVRPIHTGGLEPGECQDVPLPTGLGRAELEAVEARLGGPSEHAP